MSSFDRKQYILRQSTGKTWNFYYDERSGICYSLLTSRNTWTEPVSLHKGCHPSFFIDMDFRDCFHLLFQDSNGNLSYQYLNGEIIRTISVLESKTPGAYEKNLWLIPTKEVIHLFFTIQHGSNAILAHQLLAGNIPGKPRVVDYVTKGLCPYSLCCDRSGNIYAFYQSSDGKHLQVGFKKYINAQSFWGEFTPVSRYAGDCEYPRCILDPDNIVHLCYQRRANRQYELVYQQKMPDKNLWSAETLLHSSAYSFSDSSVLKAGSNIYVYWVREGAVYFTVSKDMGKQWSKPAKADFSSGKQVLCASYKANTPHENDKLSIREIPVSFINGFKFPFLQEASPGTGGNPSPEELRTMIVESLNLLKDSIDDLKECNAELVRNITQLTHGQQSLDRELTKNTLRLNRLENEINQIRSMTKQHRSTEESIQEMLLKFRKLEEKAVSAVKRKKAKLRRFSRKKIFFMKR